MEITVDLTDLFLITATLSIIILMILLVPLLLQIKRTALRAEALMDSINGKIAETDHIIKNARHAGESLLLTSRLIRATLAPAIVQIGGITTGIRTFFNIMHKSQSTKTKETKTDE